MKFPSWLKKARGLTTSAVISGLLVASSLFAPALAHAANEYGCGAYGAGSYNSCPSTDSSSSSSAATGGQATTPTPTGDSILLNDFNDYLNESGDGHQVNLQTNQVVFFVLQGVTHSATIKEVGSDFVTVTIASTPFDVTVKVGQTVEVDVNKDGQNDISIHLNKITSGVADLNFKQLGGAKVPAAAATTATVEATTHKANYWFWIFLGIFLLGLLIFIIIWLRRRKRKNDIGGPTNIVSPM